MFTLDRAAEALDCDRGTAVRVLEDLLEASLLTVTGTEGLAHTVRYEMPALLYAYARERAGRTADRVPVHHG